MSTDSIELTGTFADLGPAVEALTYLQTAFAHLPVMYVTIYNSRGDLDLQTSDPAAFEAWRIALQIPHTTVEMKTFASDVWLSASTTVRGVPVKLAGHSLPLTVEQARTEQPQPDTSAAPSVSTLADALGGAR